MDLLTEAWHGMDTFLDFPPAHSLEFGLQVHSNGAGSCGGYERRKSHADPSRRQQPKALQRPWFDLLWNPLFPHYFHAPYLTRPSRCRVNQTDSSAFSYDSISPAPFLGMGVMKIGARINIQPFGPEIPLSTWLVPTEGKFLGVDR